MYTPRGELDDRIIEILGREDIYQKLFECSGAGGIRRIVESVFPIELEALEESLAVICSYLAEMRMCEALAENQSAPLAPGELDSVAGGTASGDARVRAVLAGMQNRQPGFTDMVNLLLMKLQES